MSTVGHTELVSLQEKEVGGAESTELRAFCYSYQPVLGAGSALLNCNQISWKASRWPCKGHLQDHVYNLIKISQSAPFPFHYFQNIAQLQSKRGERFGQLYFCNTSITKKQDSVSTTLHYLYPHSNEAVICKWKKKKSIQIFQNQEFELPKLFI